MGVHHIPPISTRTLTDASLPVGVMDLVDAPNRLFLTGSIPAGPRVAIVGTRRPTPDAYRFARELAYELASQGVAIVSGGASGIDTAAHEGALQAGAGTLVVAPASYSCPYPQENQELFQRIVEGGGGYLTHVEDATVAKRHAFFARNALLVSLCVCVVLVQAPFRSGARNAVSWARELKRPYWVVPHAPWCSQGASCVVELRLGGIPLSGAADVLGWLQRNHHAPIPLEAASRFIAAETALPTPAPSRGGDRGAKSRVVRHDARRASAKEETQRDVAGPYRDVCKLVSHLANGPRHPDELCVVLQWDAARLQSTILHATLMGEVRRTDAGQLVSCERR